MDRQFSFQENKKSEIKQESLNLHSYIGPVKNQIFQQRLPKQTLIFSQNLYARSLLRSKFLKRSMLHLFTKKTIDQRKVIIDQLVYYQTYEKFLEDVFTNRCVNILKE